MRIKYLKSWLFSLSRCSMARAINSSRMVDESVVVEVVPFYRNSCKHFVGTRNGITPKGAVVFVIGSIMRRL
jgi:hypothetical protein